MKFANRMRSCVVPTELHEFLLRKPLHKTRDNLMTKKIQRKKEREKRKKGKIKHEHGEKEGKQEKKRKNKKKGMFISLRRVT